MKLKDLIETWMMISNWGKKPLVSMVYKQICQHFKVNMRIACVFSGYWNDNW